MKTLNGGTAAPSGHYLHLRNWEIVPIASGGGTLPGPLEDRYLRLPTIGVLAVTPILGGLFVMFLPVVGIVLTVAALLGHRGASSETELLSPSADAS